MYMERVHDRATDTRSFELLRTEFSLSEHSIIRVQNLLLSVAYCEDMPVDVHEISD